MSQLDFSGAVPVDEDFAGAVPVDDFPGMPLDVPPKGIDESAWLSMHPVEQEKRKLRAKQLEADRLARLTALSNRREANALIAGIKPGGNVGTTLSAADIDRARQISGPETLPSKSSIRPLSDEEFARAVATDAENRAFAAGKLPATERFAAGVRSAITRFGAGAAKQLDLVAPEGFFDKALADYRSTVERSGEKAVGAAGVVGSAAGSIPGFIAAAESSAVGLPLYIMSALGNARADMDVFEQSNDVAIPTGERAATLFGTAAVSALEVFLGKKIVFKGGGAALSKVGNSLVKGDLAAAGKALIKGAPIVAAEAGAVNTALNVAYNAVIKFGYDEDHSLNEGNAEAFATGSLFALAFGGLKIAEGAGGQRVRDSLVKTRLVSEAEMKVVGDDPAKVFEIAKARQAGNLVEVTNDGIKVTPDNITWDEKIALGHNEALLKEVRAQRAAGKPVDIFVPPERGAVRPEELSDVATGLERLKASLKVEPTEFDPETKAPLTKRAVLSGDVDYLLATLKTRYKDRTLVNQAKALIDTAKRKGLVEDTSPARPEPDLIGPRQRILTPLDRVKDRMKLTVESARPYLADPKTLTNNVRLQGVVEREQVRLLRNIFALRRGTVLSLSQAYALSKHLEAQFVDRMARRLEKKDNDDSQGAKAQVIKHIERSKVAPELKPLAVDQVSGAIDSIIRQTSTMTQRETVARLIEELSDPSRNVPEPILNEVENLYKRMTGGEELTWGARVRQGLREATDLSKSVIKSMNDSRAGLVKSIESLPPERAKPLLERVALAQGPDELKAIIEDTVKEHTRFIRDTTTARVVEQARRLEKSPQRDAGFELIRQSLGEKLERGAEVVGTVAPKSRFETLVRDLGLAKKPKAEFKITPEEQAKLSLAQDKTAYAALSEQHKYFSDRWDKLSKVGALTKEETLLLRYLFADMSPEVMKSVGAIKSKKRLNITDVYGKELRGGHPADYYYNTKVLRMARTQPEIEGGGTRNFMHEFMHGAYFNYLDFETTMQLEVEWRKLRETKADDYESEAHRVIGEGFISSQPTEIIDYFANDPWEFFAESGARYFLENKISPALSKTIWKQALDTVKQAYEYAMRYFSVLSRNARTTDILPQPFVDALDSIIKNTGKGKMTRIEASDAYNEKLYNDAFETKAPKPDKPVFSTSPTTGKVSIDVKALEERLAKLPLEKAQALQRELTRVVRRGQVERGLYNKWLKFSAVKDAKSATKTLAEKADQGRLRKKLEPIFHVGKFLFDPVATEGKILQMAGGDMSSEFYKIFAGNHEKGYSKAQSNIAEGHKAVVRVAKALGFDASGARGEFKLARYMNKKLASGLSRGEAMWAYALATDPGRVEALKEHGVSVEGKKYSAADAVADLSVKDRAFVDGLKKFFDNNPFVEKAYDLKTLLTGTVEQRGRGWFSSVRGDSPKLPRSSADIELGLTKKTSSLEGRTESGSGPFKLDGGFLPEFYSVVRELGSYAEMGKDLFRAERLLANPEFKQKLIDTHGENAYKALVSYTEDLAGRLHSPQGGVDSTIRYVVQAYGVSKIATNVASAVRQTLSLFTMLADDTLDSSAILQAVSEGAPLSNRISREMRESSGVAHRRLSGGGFIENLLVGGDKHISPTLRFIQNESLFMQRFLDGRVLNVAWRAAEIMAKRRGLKGAEAKEFVINQFEKSLTRTQASSSPVYTSELERYAKQHTLALGALSFKRDLNRAYNTARRHVVTAAQRPTPENVRKAVNAVFWTGVNAAGNTGISSAKALAFGYGAYSASEWLVEGIRNLAGLLYVGGDISDAIVDIVDDKPSNNTRSGPVLGAITEFVNAGKAGYKALEAGNLDPDEANISAGINRGESKESQALLRAFDQGLAGASSLLGLPLWMMWHQGKGLYNWKRDDYRLMLRLEKEYEKLKPSPDRNAVRLQEISKLRERINKIHRLRERGLMSKSDAQKAIVRELQSDAN